MAVTTDIIRQYYEIADPVMLTTKQPEGMGLRLTSSRVSVTAGPARFVGLAFETQEGAWITATGRVESEDFSALDAILASGGSEITQSLFDQLLAILKQP